MKNITYTERNGIRYPNLTLPEQTNYPLGKYAILSLGEAAIFEYAFKLGMQIAIETLTE